MTQPYKTFETVLRAGSDANIRFEDLRHLVKALGFRERINGDHHILSRTGVEEIINIQPLRNGKAKVYQIKQVRRIITRYHLEVEP